jgi:hypothetical protein
MGKPNEEISMKKFALYVLIATCIWITPAFSAEQKCALPPSVIKKLGATPLEKELLNGRLKVINIYKLQAETLLNVGDMSDERSYKAMADKLYSKNPDFWQGYVGSKEDYIKLSAQTDDLYGHLICKVIPKLVDIDVNKVLIEHFKKLEKTRSKNDPPLKLKWHLAYASGATDIGELRNTGMLIDFARQSPNSSALKQSLQQTLEDQDNFDMPCKLSSNLEQRINQVPDSMVLFDGQLNIFNIYKQQAKILLDSAKSNQPIPPEQWKNNIYQKNPEFWDGYVGKENFLVMSNDLEMRKNQLLCHKIPALLDLDLSSRFNRDANWLKQETGRSVKGN